MPVKRWLRTAVLLLVMLASSLFGSNMPPDELERLMRTQIQVKQSLQNENEDDDDD